MAERNPQVPHCMQSLLYVERNGIYCGYKPELIIDSISGVFRDFITCSECKGICRKARHVGKKSICGICFGGKNRNFDRKAENKVATLYSKCPLEEHGCNWTGMLGEIEKHMNECQRLLVECQLKCGFVSERETCKQHSKEVCQLRKIECHHCNEQLEAFRHKQHVKSCNSHPDTEVPCPYMELGCDVMTLRRDMGIHLTENMLGHQRLMLDQLNQLRERNNQLEERNKQLEQFNEEQKDKNAKQKNRNQKQETVNNQQGIVNYELKCCNEKQAVVNIKQQKVNREQESCNEQHIIRSQKQETINNQQGRVNQVQESCNDQQEVKNKQLEQFNEQQKNRNQKQEQMNNQLEIMNYEHDVVNRQLERGNQQQNKCHVS